MFAAYAENIQTVAAGVDRMTALTKSALCAIGGFLLKTKANFFSPQERSSWQRRFSFPAHLPYQLPLTIRP
jgi:hypothetical protein